MKKFRVYREDTITSFTEVKAETKEKAEQFADLNNNLEWKECGEYKNELLYGESEEIKK